MEEEKKYLDYQGLQTYHENLLAVLEESGQATAEALDNLDDRLKDIESENPYSKLEIDDLLEPITDKLDNIEEFAEVNVLSDWNQTNSDADDYIKNKPTSMPASDVSAWAKASSKPSYTKDEIGLSNVTNDSQVKRSEMGAASGVATLDSAGKVPSSQLPSYVDDVLEYDTKSAFPETGEGGKIYVDKSNNTSWRWSGSTYTQIKGDLVIGTTSGTAADGGIANTHYNNTSNPHGVTKAQVGLGDVGNFKAVSTVASQELTDTEKSNARTNIGLGTLATKSSLTAEDIPTITKNKISDFPESMPASDVSAWAKESSKPTYIASEVMSISVVNVTGNISSSCSITEASNAGKAQTIIYVNNGSSDFTVTVPTTYKTPDGAAIELTCPVGGYCEVSYLNIGGTIYARGL